LGLRKFRLRQTHSLRGDFHLAFQVRDARVGLVQLRAQNLALVPLFQQVIAQARLRRIAEIDDHGQPGNQQPEQYGYPPRRTGRLVSVGFMRAWYIWRNAHSSLSVMVLPLVMAPIANYGLQKAFCPSSLPCARSSASSLSGVPAWAGQLRRKCAG